MRICNLYHNTEFRQHTHTEFYILSRFSFSHERKHKSYVNFEFISDSKAKQRKIFYFWTLIVRKPFVWKNSLDEISSGLWSGGSVYQIRIQLIEAHLSSQGNLRQICVKLIIYIPESRDLPVAQSPASPHCPPQPGAMAADTQAPHLTPSDGTAPPLTPDAPDSHSDTHQLPRHEHSLTWHRDLRHLGDEVQSDQTPHDDHRSQSYKHEMLSNHRKSQSASLSKGYCLLTL